jgi:hypothetical protein
VEREARRAARPPVEVRIRDLDRIREKTPLYLEPRHLALLAGVLVAVLAGAFVGGWWLGRDDGAAAGKVAGAPAAPVQPPGEEARGAGARAPEAAGRHAVQGRVLPPPPDLVARAEEGTAAGARRETEAVPEPPAAPPEPVPAPVAVAAAPEPVPTLVPIAAPAPVPEPAPAPEPPAPAPEPPAPTPGPVVVAVAAVAATPTPEPPAPTPEPPAPEAGEDFWPFLRVTDLDLCASCVVADGACTPPAPPAPAPAPSVEGVASAPGTAPDAPPVPADVAAPSRADVAAKPVAAAKPAPAARPAPVPKAAGTWSVQARSYKDEAGAQEYAAVLKTRGYTARVFPFDDRAGTRWYRVRIGRFTTLAAAQSFASTFNRRESETAIAVEAP